MRFAKGGTAAGIRAVVPRAVVSTEVLGAAARRRGRRA